MRNVLLFTLLVTVFQLQARDGMWMPGAISLNEDEMRAMGMQLHAADLYNTAKPSLKDAVVRFSSGCTGEVISGSGLVMTNHHCGFNFIQALSTLQQNYLANGFWADSLSKEIPCPGLTITFIERIENVTAAVMQALGNPATESEREARVKAIGDSLEKSATAGTLFTASVRPFFYGNEYYMTVARVYRDIRLAGTPPLNIGRFGGETDNWTWPRHTCDFSLFRIYADSANNPADYSPSNVPYKAAVYFTVSLNGVKEGDFSMVYGFPGLTKQYLSSYGLNQVLSYTNPDRVAIRDVKLKSWESFMQKNDTVKLQYAAKYKTIANYYKKWKGELESLRRNHVLEEKQALEARMKLWIDSDSARKKEYGNLLGDLEEQTGKLQSLSHGNDYLNEAGLGVEAFVMASRYRKLVSLSTADTVDITAVINEASALRKGIPAAYRNYSREVDERTGAELLRIYAKNVSSSRRPWIFDYINGNYDDDYGAFLHDLFKRSLFMDTVRLAKLLTNYKPRHARQLVNDPIYDVMKSLYDFQDLQLTPGITSLQSSIAALQRKYMKALREMDAGKNFWPEANSTLRIGYGKVEGMHPRDGVTYSYYSTLNGLVEKSNDPNPDYKLNDSLARVIVAGDYGRYAVNGTVPVAFLASCHTTGGNSGSPALNARGELVGINFDGVWEGLTTDYAFDDALTKNMAVDIRYILFIMDKIGHADRLLGELKISGVPGK